MVSEVRVQVGDRPMTEYSMDNIEEFVTRFSESGIPLLQDIARLWDDLLADAHDGERLTKDDFASWGEVVARTTRLSLSDVFMIAGEIKEGI